MKTTVQQKFLSLVTSPRRMGQRIKEVRECRLIEDSGLFDRKFYLSAYPDVAKQGIDPVLHYVLHGSQEGRNPSAVFSTKRYRQRHNLPPNGNPLVHCIQQRPGRKPPLPGGLDNIFEWQLEADNIALLPTPEPNEIGVFVHLFFEELAKEVLGRLGNIPFEFRVYISTDTEEKRRSIETVLTELALAEKAIIKVLPNYGWDLGPFLIGFAKEIQQHEICLRLHTKKSTFHEPSFGLKWRRHLLSELVGHPMLVAGTVALLMSNKDLGVVMPSHWDGIRAVLGMGPNFQTMRNLLGRIGVNIRPDQPIEYPSGSMFWFRSEALAPLLESGLGWDDFLPTDDAKRDGTLAHGIERSLLFCAAKARFRWAYSPTQKLLSELTEEACLRLIQGSDEFDSSYYVKMDRNVARDGWDPLEHYVRHGWGERRNPSARFNAKYYESQIAGTGYKDVNPLVHYILIGKEEGLRTERRGTTAASILVDDLYGAYRKADTAPTYVKEVRPIIRETTIKPIAFYFPQFHPFEENNRFWGRGFTEWTNTTKALPMFPGHYQPRLPGELGFYDTRLREVLARQMELARQYGIYGFCFHHYFFDGKPVMRVPYNHILADKSLDLPFCLHWANEPWTVRWDGLAEIGGTLLDQHHTPDDDIAFFKDIEPAITDPRYITVEGRPLLAIYRPGLFPDIRATVDRWRKCCRTAGLADLYLVVMQTSFDGPVDPRKYGFDAAIEYPPHNLEIAEVSKSVTLYDPAFEGQMYDYREAVEKALARPEAPYTLFRGIMPDWDCTPRRANPALYINTSPELYRSWLEGLCKTTVQRLPDDRRFIFVNAWNEWAEGAYLEPDRRYGYGYLDATAKALNAFGPAESNLRLHAVVGAHIFYTDLLPEFVEKFKNIAPPFDLIVTTPHDKVDSVRRDLLKGLAGVRIEVIGVGSVGRDFAPFIFEFMPRTAAYDVCCWVHSKKSLYEPAYAGWRDYLLRNLLGSSENVTAILGAFAKNERLGLVYPASFQAIAGKVEWGSNYELCRNLLGRLGITVHDTEQPRFPTAAMFWFRPRALEPLTRLGLTMEDFERNADGARDPTTNAVIDGTISHALERMIIYVAEAAGFTTREFLFER